MRRLTKTPHEIAVLVAHRRISYGEILEARRDLLAPLKRAIFLAVKSEIEKALESSP